MQALRAFLFGDEDGVTAIEYALIASLIFLVIVAAVSFTGTSLELLYKDVADKVAGVLASP